MKRTLIAVTVVGVLAAFGLYVHHIFPETVQSAKPGQHYLVALGDSVAAGAGLSGNKGQAAAGCDLADTAFPFLLGSQLHLPVQQLACSKATVAQTASSTNNLAVSQYNTAKPYLPGSDVVVYGGANDIGWLSLLVSCTQKDCASDANRATVTIKTAQLQQNLTSLLVKLQQSKPRRLVVNTYYTLLAPTDTCFAGLGISPSEVSFINTEEAELNSAITAAATSAHATAVAIDFGGHSLCSKDSWIQNITDGAPLHPTKAGQQQIARQDAAALL